MLLLICGLGGMAGAYARFQLSGWIYARTGADFPWGTLAVNVSGSVLLGLLLPWLSAAETLGGPAAPLQVGLIGAFTTFSTFAYEAVMLVQAGQRARAAAYVVSSLALGLMGIMLGLGVGQWLF
jgi:CrcB protein